MAPEKSKSHWLGMGIPVVALADRADIDHFQLGGVVLVRRSGAPCLVGFVTGRDKNTGALTVADVLYERDGSVGKPVRVNLGPNDLIYQGRPGDERGLPLFPRERA
jgi:hypothetical protein